MRKMLMCAMFLSTAAPAFAADPVRFERDGSRFEYVVTDQASGRRVISGRNLTTGRAFRLLVAGRTVSGTVGADSVNFQLPRQPLRTEIASN